MLLFKIYIPFSVKYFFNIMTNILINNIFSLRIVKASVVNYHNIELFLVNIISMQIKA